MDKLRRAYHEFFFAAEPIARVRLFRRGLALWTVVYLGQQLPHLEELYCRPILREGRFDAWFGIPPPPYALIAGLMAALLVALALVIVDVATRRAQLVVVALFLTLSLLEASPPRAYGELAMVQWPLVALAPVGPPDRLAPRWGTRLVMLQLSAVYVYAALAKLVEGPAWRDGEAIVLISRSAFYGQHLLSAGVTVERGPLALALAWSTVALELGIGVLLWPARTRVAAACGLVVLHLGIAATMRISLLFHALMILHLVLFVGPPWTWRRRG